MSLQVPDWITFRGRHRQLLSHPLDAYLRALPDRPDFRLRGSGQDRGYVASWEVRPDDTLWLTGLTTRPDGDGPDPGTELVFPEPGPVEATWVTQCLRTPDTEQRRYSPLGYGTTYAREAYLSVWRGRLVMVEEIDGKTSRRVGGELTPHLDTVFGPEEGAFLRAAFAAPDDAAPRLVYADWLDERHDPRAAVIRTAERHRRLDPEAVAREHSTDRDQLRRGMGHWLWARLMGYQHLMTEVIAVVA
jgi:uncharacterized protein (TIGR02996 family)